MARILTNKHDISLPLAVFLLLDKYDHDPRPNQISATSLMNPIRQLTLMHQNKNIPNPVDISDLVASRMGSAIHDGCEEAWTDLENVKAALKVLGAGDGTIDKVRINPTEKEEGTIPVYIEQRTEKEVNGYIVSGKFDLVLDGTVNDYKSTSVWGFIYDSNAESHARQGSIYRWLNPDKITSDYVNIQYIFTDWSKSKAMQDPSGYPQLRVQTKKYPLHSLEETDLWIKARISELDSLKTTPQELLPECSDEELWATETLYKYYKNPAKMTRATKNFKSMDEALAKQGADGNVGTVVTVPGQVRKCTYCPVSEICDQAKQLVAAGRLTL